MTSRLVAGMMVLLSVPGIAVAGDSRAKRSTGQTVGRAANLVTPKLQTQRTTKSAASNTAASRSQLASSAQPAGRLTALATVKSAARREQLTSPARAANLKLPGQRSSSGVLQLMPASESQSSGNVLTLVPQSGVLQLQPARGRSSGQKVLTLVPDRPAELMQFQSDDQQLPAATIMPLGVSEKKSEPAATLLQFED